MMKLFRQIFRNKWLAAINIFGLAVGLAASMFLLLHLNYQFSFDNYFSKKDRIYRLLTQLNSPEGTENYPICLRNVVGLLKQEVPEVEDVVQMYDYENPVYKYGDSKQVALRTMIADSAFFSVFDFKILYGDIAEAMSGPSKCVVTEKVANKLFGKTNVVGETISMGDSNPFPYKIVAVMQDVPENTHFGFEMMTLMTDHFTRMGSLEFHTYVLFKKGVDQKAAVDKCNALYVKQLTDRFQIAGSTFDSILEPLPTLHVSSKASFNLVPAANKTNLYFIVAVVFFVLGIAITNFIALTVIQGERRSLEVSIRKTNGAGRGNMIGMLFGETAVTTLIAFFLGLALFVTLSDALAGVLNIALPRSEHMLDRLWGLSPRMGLNFLLLFAGTALLAGFYPALYLSRFSPMSLIRKSVERKHRLTTASVIVQFSVVVFCVTALMVVDKQLGYMKEMPLGYEPENVMLVSVSANYNQYDGFRSELLQTPQIVSVALSQGSPSSGFSGQLIRLEGQNKEASISIDERGAGRGYFETYRIPIIEGRDFTGNYEIDKGSLILSETAVKALGLEHPIGQKLVLWDETLEVVGVAGDILGSANEKAPVLMYTGYASGFYTLAVRFEPGRVQEAKAAVSAVYAAHYPQRPMDIVMLHDLIQNQYKQDEVTFKILTSGSVLAIILALLGLLALSGFAARQKRREIGVRRVMGAQVSNVVDSLMRYILVRILPALPIGMAVAYYVMHKWLQGFAHTTGMSWWIFILAGAATLVIALLTILAQTFRAATANPVDAIRANE